jgi:ABC-type multidrug transport system ATPase subunit
MVTAMRRKARSFGATTARRSLDFDVPHGETLGYLGPNGVGKTTTI